MRSAVWGSFVGAGLITALGVWWSSIEPVHAAGPRDSMAATAELITYSSEIDDHRQQLTVIDPVMKVVTVYHVAKESGEITLKSVRNIRWDLQLEDFNSASPRPQEIKRALDTQ
jgi:hypothetical protein